MEQQGRLYFYKHCDGVQYDQTEDLITFFVFPLGLVGKSTLSAGCLLCLLVGKSTVSVGCDFSAAPGTYNYESAANFDSYLRALGVGFIMRQLAGIAQPVVTVSLDCGGGRSLQF